MSAVIQTKPKPSSLLQSRTTDSNGSSNEGALSSDSVRNSPHRNVLAENESAHKSDNGGSIPTINDVASLKKGIIKNKEKERYTVFLIGETGVGKSSVLELIANVLIGKGLDHYDFDILSRANEQGGRIKQRQTNSAHLYEFTSNNGIMVRILDTPGLADTRGIKQDELHKGHIASQIKCHTDSVTAVLVLANDAVPRVTVGTDYTLSTLSAILPKSLASNTAFMFTNVSSPQHWSLSRDALPDVLKDAPQFLLENPIALQKKYSKLKDSPNMNDQRANLCKAMKAAERNALEMLVDLFDWLDGLEPHSVTEIVSLYDHSQAIEAKVTDILAQMNQAATMEAKIEEQMGTFQRASADMEACSNKPLGTPVWKQQRVPNSNYLCNAPGCHSSCHSFRLFTPISRLLRLRCATCNHSHRSHSRTRHVWAQENDTQASVEEGLKKWEEAKAAKEGTELLIATNESALRDLNDAMGRTMVALARLAEDYSALSLSGPFSAHMEKAIRLLEHRYKDMEQKGIGEEQLEKMRDNLDLMKRKLELVTKAEEKALKEM